MSIRDMAQAALQHVMANAAASVVTGKITMSNGQKWETQAHEQAESHGAIAADGQLIADTACVLYVLPTEDFTIEWLRGAKVELVRSASESLFMRIIAATESTAGAYWRLTCAAEGKAL